MHQSQRDARSELQFERMLLLLLTAAMRYTTLILAHVLGLRFTALMVQGALCRLNCRERNGEREEEREKGVSLRGQIFSDH